MALQTEIWVAEIAANLFKDNSFVRRSKRDDAFVENKIVHLPQSGATPKVVRDRSTYPAVIAQRADSDNTYNTHEFTSDVTHITDIDAIEVSYAKRQNVLSDHISTIDDKMSDYVAYTWTPSTATQVVKTSGANRSALAVGATGNRKRITKTDILEAKRLLDRMNVPATGRVLLLNSDMYNDLLTDSDLLNAFFMNVGNLSDGVVARIYGFDIMIRTNAATMTAGFAPKDPEAVAAATDNAVSLAWHPSFVRAALGEVKVYADENKPEYYGSIFSAMARAGASPTYTDFRGIVAISEQA
jgi:Phage capsid protein